MRYILIHDYTKFPLLIYDGGEPKQILYRVQGVNNKLLCKVDLWKGTDDKLNDNKTELEAIREVFNLKKKISLGVDTITASINGEDVLAYFSDCPDPKKPQERIIVCFSLFEKQPTRYQCYVIGVLRENPADGKTQ